LELEGAWEVGLLEIASPSSIENVSEDQCYYTIYFKPGNSYTIVRVLAGLYKIENLLVDALHDAQRKQLRNIGAMTDDAPLMVTFRAPFASRMGMRVELSDDVLSLEFSPDLAGILGFDANMKYSGHEPIWGQRVVDMYGSLGLVYVYCDLAEYVLVGDKKAPLLRIVDRPSDIKSIEHCIMNPVQSIRTSPKEVFRYRDGEHHVGFGYSGSIFSRKNGGGFGISSSHAQLFFDIKALPLEGTSHSTLRP